jgi:hypothetical protein
VLVDAVQDVLDRGVEMAYRMRPDPTEVTFLKALFRRGIRRLEDGVAAEFAPLGLRVSVGGIYVHSRPIVFFDDPRGRRRPWSCELGDLLVLVRYSNGRPPVDYALILQAKRGSAPIAYSRRAKEYRQWFLYNQWPVFWWRYAPFARGDLDLDRRHVRPPRPHVCAQYACIEQDDAAQSAVLRAALADAADPGRALAAELADLVMRGSGRKFSDQATAHGRIGWDRVVWDLLESWVVKHRRRYHNTGLFLAHSGTSFVGGSSVPSLLRESWFADAFEDMWAGGGSVDDLRDDEEDGGTVAQATQPRRPPPRPSMLAVDDELPGPDPMPTMFVEITRDDDGPLDERRR